MVLSTRAFTAGAGAVLLLGVGAMAAADVEHSNAGVDVTVGIEPIEEPGVLALSVASDSVALEENGSDSTARVFTGELPTVTVSDTRVAGDIDPTAAWYVLGTSSDFTSGDGDTIAAANLGWEPRMVDAGELGAVAPGDPVDPELDGGPGLQDQELLTGTWNSTAVNEEGQWSATADLELKTETTVEPGDYGAVMTLSLFERGDPRSRCSAHRRRSGRAHHRARPLTSRMEIRHGARHHHHRRVTAPVFHPAASLAVVARRGRLAPRADGTGRSRRRCGRDGQRGSSTHAELGRGPCHLGGAR